MTYFCQIYSQYGNNSYTKISINLDIKLTYLFFCKLKCKGIARLCNYILDVTFKNFYDNNTISKVDFN